MLIPQPKQPFGLMKIRVHVENAEKLKDRQWMPEIFYKGILYSVLKSNNIVRLSCFSKNSIIKVLAQSKNLKKQTSQTKPEFKNNMKIKYLYQNKMLIF